MSTRAYRRALRTARAFDAEARWAEYPHQALSFSRPMTRAEIDEVKAAFAAENPDVTFTVVGTPSDPAPTIWAPRSLGSPFAEAP